MDEQPDNSNIARQTIFGSAYSVAASAITLVLGVIRTYLMVTFLLPEEVGLAALGLFWVELVNTFSATGLGSAFIHRQEVDETVRRTYFTFSLAIGLASFLVILALIPIVVPFYPEFDGLGLVILVYACITLIKLYNQPQTTMLNKNLSFLRIAWLDVAGAVASTVVGPLMAASGFGVWAIVGDYSAGLFVRFLLFQFWIKSWRPRMGWDRSIAVWFWNYGKSVWMASNLNFVIDNFDDFWVGTTLGKSPLGLYNKAYEFSRYPRRVVANPIISVFFPAFARLQQDRQKLSRAFFRSTSLMVRSSFLFSLALILAAPEIFSLFLSPAWHPMQRTFQLMIVYTMLDPLSLAAQRLLHATGHPAVVTRIRWFQTAIFIPAVILGAHFFGIEGVALAADLMMFAGVYLLFRSARLVVDFSALSLWRWPVIATLLVIPVILSLDAFLPITDLRLSLALKWTLITGIYAAVLYLAEGAELTSGLKMILDAVKPKVKRDD